MPAPPVDLWLVCDARAELMPQIRRYGRGLNVEPVIKDFHAGGLVVEPLPVVHTSHPTFGYLVQVSGRRVVWAPEFWEFPGWARGADLMFADAAGWRRPIRFARGVGGHAAVSATADQARRHGVGRLVFAHIGRPVIRAIDAGQEPPVRGVGSRGPRLPPVTRPTARTFGVRGDAERPWRAEATSVNVDVEVMKRRHRRGVRADP
ncbi:hypothetical protein GCM10023191_066050 [Actinoallomurus oryzae]|uniref:Metallo-beta-lactamase domain-containing protein n=1 Tax=Actinoallomurus oryzae TaxID=502180 RepID=A0ABP8QPG4_9ACTN